MSQNQTAASLTLHETLKGKFVIANLGAALDKDYPLPDDIRQCVTLVELDAGDRPIDTQTGGYHRKVTVRSAVAGTKGRRTFTTAAHLGNCSLLKPDRDIIRYFGVDDLWRELSSREVETTTFPEVLAANNVTSLDFLKTDLEGLDFEVIKSCETLLPGILAVQAELRFHPFYFGEAPADEVIGYLRQRGFDLVTLNPYYWKPDSRDRDRQRDGVLTYVDAVFLRRPETLPAETMGTSIAKLIVLAFMLEKRCHGAWLLEQFGSRLPATWVPQLQPLVQPGSFVRKFKAAMFEALKGTAFGRRHLEKKYGMSFRHYSPTVFNFHNV